MEGLCYFVSHDEVVTLVVTNNRMIKGSSPPSGGMLTDSSPKRLLICSPMVAGQISDTLKYSNAKMICQYVCHIRCSQIFYK